MSDLEALRIDRSPPTRRPSGRRRGRGLGWIVALVLVAAAGWVFRTPVERARDRVRLPEVETIRVKRSTAAAASAVSGTAANGYVVAERRAALSADTPGRIVEMNVTEGSVVKKGDVVARLFSDEYRAALRRAEADLSAAKAAVDRALAERDVSASSVERARSDAEAAAASLDEAGATRKLAELTLARAERLVEQNVQSAQTLDEARAGRDQAAAGEAAAASRLAAAKAGVFEAETRLASAEARIAEVRAGVPVAEAIRDGAQATLEKTEVRAPFDGIVVLKDAEVGEVVSPNAVGSQSRGSVVTMVDFDTLEVQVEVPETSLSAVSIGARAQIFLDAFPGDAYGGRVLRIWPTANRQKATVEVRVGFDQPDERLRPEMGVRVVFSEAEIERPAAETPEGILLPVECLVRLEGRTGVFVLERDVARFRAVTAGEEKAGRVLVRDGLEEGEQVVASPPASLSDGDRVQVSE